jgi:hypothetical protein
MRVCVRVGVSNVSSGAFVIFVERQEVEEGGCGGGRKWRREDVSQSDEGRHGMV